MAAVIWYVARNRQKLGPFSTQQLRQLAECGFVQASDMVLADGSTKWVEASSIPGMFPGADQKKYWVAVKGKTHGPYVADQINAGLAMRQFTLDTQVWPEQTKKWTTLSALAEFRERVGPSPSTLGQSQAKLLAGALELEEAALHLAGKSGDEFAKLMSVMMDLRRAYADHSELMTSLDRTIEMLRAKREEFLKAGPEGPAAAPRPAAK
jgi:hypothetical protein